MHHERPISVLLLSREEWGTGKPILSGTWTDPKLGKGQGLASMGRRPTSLEEYPIISSLEILAIDLCVRKNLGNGLRNANTYVRTYVPIAKLLIAVVLNKLGNVG